MARTDAIVQTNVDNGTLVITVAGFDPIIVDPVDYGTDLIEQAALHGFKQKYADAAALGKDATPKEKHEAIMALVQWHRDANEWNRNNQGDGSGGDGLLVRAIMEVAGLERDAARVAVKGMDKPTQHAMRQSKELRPVIDRLRAEKPAPKGSGKIDVAGVLAGLMKV